MIKIGFVSLGCAKNTVDSEVMLGYLVDSDIEVTNDPGQADVIVVNTCGFIDKAKEESINTILEMASYKKHGNCKRLVVAGCLVQRYRDQIMDQIPEIDAVIGLDQLSDIVQVCTGDPAAIHGGTGEISTYLYNHENRRVLTTPGYSAYIKIAEGCNHSCSFCVIPSIRGRFRSRQPDSVIREAEILAGQGVKELNLVAQDTSLYGHDLQIREGLSSLLKDLCFVDGIEWIRFLYTYPNSITPALLETVAGNSKICNYVDIPLQHVSSSVLSNMNRGGSPEASRDLIRRIRRTIPDVAVRTTFIVGFPGETEDDFKELVDFVGEMEFDHMGVFSYSDEEGSAAVTHGNKVSDSLKEERLDLLMSLQAGISLENNQRKIGRSYTVLVDGVSEETDMLWEGRMPGQAPDIDGVVYINDGIDASVKPGDLRTVKISEAFEYDLAGGLE
jgi:ribosomal protein S12 methylthiotransferase